jgi:hypothetical protein
MTSRKYIFCLALVLGGLSGLTGSARGADDLKIMISIPQMDEAPDRWTADHKPVWMRAVNGSYPYPECFVVVENCSSRPLLFFGSTGEDGLLGKLSFEVTGSDGKTTVVKPGFPVPTANIPLVQKLDAGQAMVFEFHPGPYDFPFPEQGNTESVTMRAIFEQKPFSFAAGKGGNWGDDAWIGKAVSDPCEVLFKK